jgi:5-methylthioadenosine/S-adenosylhomocysteine deaminase
MSKVMADFVVRARWVLPMTSRDVVLPEHSVVVANGRIVEVLPWHEADARFASARTFERPEHVLMPGLINAHTHAAMSLLRGYAEGLPLTAWLREKIWPLEQRYVSPEFVRDGTALAIAEMLRGGISCFADMYFFPDEAARVCAEQGMRAVIGLPIIDMATPWAANTNEYFAKALRVRDEYQGHPTIETVFAPHAPYSVGDDTFKRLRTLADELDAGICIHLQESAAEVAFSEKSHGCRPIERLESLGLLRPGLNAIHMVHLSESDMVALQRTGLSITVCPESNLKLGNGQAPFAQFRSSGARIAIGTDGPASNNDQDLWAEMKLAALLSRPTPDAPPAVTPWDALAMATCGAADALNLPDIGVLSAHKWADLCCLDVSAPAMQPMYDVPAQLVYSGGRDCVSDVWVAGRHLVEDNKLTRLDWQPVAARARYWATRIVQEAR